MYEVSNTFKAASKNFIIKPALRGKINDESFTDDDIVENSFRCCNQCTDVAEVKLGGVFVGELRMTLLSEFTRNRSDWVGSTITFEYGLLVGDEYEYIPAPSGIYTIYEAIWTEAGLDIVAYDNMAKFDRSFAPIFSRSTPYAWLNLLCRLAKVELGTSELVIRDMCNGTAEIMIPTDYGVQSCRDLISYLATVLGGFATINRKGQLEIRQFKGRIVDTIKAKERFSGFKLSDYVTTFTGLKVTSLIDGEEKTFTVPPFTGLTMNIGANPFLQFGGNITANDMRMNVLKSLEYFAYRPFSVTTLGCCMYDLGDVITFSDGIAIGTDCCIMSYDFDLYSYSFAGYGANPALETARNKYDKSMSSSTRTSRKDTMSVTEVTNLEEVSISNDWRAIASVTFAVSSEQMVQFQGAVKTNLEARDNVQFKYVVNNIEQPFIHDENLAIVDTATLFHVFEAQANVYTNLIVMCKTNTTTGQIKPFSFHGALLGIGLAKDANEGNINETDVIKLIHRRNSKFALVEGECKIEVEGATQITASDKIRLIANRRRKFNLNDDKRENFDIVTASPILRRLTEDGKIRKTENNITRIAENTGED